MACIGKNFAYMVRQLPRLTTDEQFVEAGLATLEHHFDNHHFCGDWCRRKNQPASRQQDHDRFYRSKTKDAELYTKLQEIVEKYITVDRLKEVSHGMDTNINESFNNTFSWLAPKNKVDCGTQSLQTRLTMGIGIQGLGLLEYFKKLFVKLGIEITSNVLNFLSVKETKQAKRISKVKLTDSKKQQLHAKFEALRQNEAIAKKERAKREGTYKTGINMEDISEDDGNNNKNPNNKNCNKRKSVVCKHCGKKGHSTTRSKKCLRHKDNNTCADELQVQNPVAVGLQLTFANVADDVDNMDSIPLTVLLGDAPSRETGDTTSNVDVHGIL